MAYKVQKPCKICGKLYTPCPECENDKSAFHWRTVACSIECGRKYFELVEIQRNHITLENNKNKDEKDTKIVYEESPTVLPKTTRKKKEIKAEESEQIE